MEIRNEISKDLTDAFIRYQFRLENPMPSPKETFALMVDYYRNDPVFHSKVQSLVGGVMQIISKRLDI